MIPLFLSIRGFLSYQQLTEIDFTAIDLACVSGANGAGKSSIFDAITWALFGVARKNDDTIIHSHPEVKAAEVGLIFEYENNLYRIQRTRPRNATTRLEFHVASPETIPDFLNLESLPQIRWHNLTERTMRETQAQIQNILRLDYETFTNASFFLQGKADQFTTQNPTNRKKILGTILGLEIWEEYKQRAIDRRKQVENEINLINLELQDIESELNEETARREHLKQIETQLAAIQGQRKEKAELVAVYRQQLADLEAQKRAVEELWTKVQNNEKESQALHQKLQGLYEEREAYQGLLDRSAQIEERYQRHQALKAQLETYEQLMLSFTDLEKQLQKIQAELHTERVRLEQELTHLTEKQKRAENAEKNLHSLQTQIASLQEKQKQAEAELAKCLQAEQQSQLLQGQMNELKGKNSHLKEEMHNRRERIDKLMTDPLLAECPLCGQPLSPADRQNLIQNLEEEGKKLKEIYLANKTQIAQLEAQINQLQKISQQRAQIERSLRQLEGEKEKKATTLNSESEILKEWQQSGAPRLLEIQAQLQSDSFLPNARKNLQEVETQIQALGYDRQAHDKARHEESQLRSVVEEYQRLMQAQAVLPQLTRQIEDHEKQKQEHQQKSEELLQTYQAERTRFEQAQKQAPDLQAAEKELRRLEDEEAECNRELGAARQRVEVLKELKKRAQKLHAEKAAKATLISRYKILERAFGKDGVPALLIEQALPQIEERANQILYRLSDGNMSLRFNTQAKYKDSRRQDLRETLEIQISDSKGIRDYELFSGGEAFRINFAIRLAISELLAHRAGARLQTLVIDEGFGSQDAQGRQQLIEAINRVRGQFAKILVITHLDELKDAFPNRLEVEKTPAGSKVRLV